MKLIFVILFLFLVSCSNEELRTVEKAFEKALEKEDKMARELEAEKKIPVPTAKPTPTDNPNEIYEFAKIIYSWLENMKSYKIEAKVVDNELIRNHKKVVIHFRWYDYDREFFGTTRPWTYADIEKLLATNDREINEVGEIFEKHYIEKVLEKLNE